MASPLEEGYRKVLVSTPEGVSRSADAEPVFRRFCVGMMSRYYNIVLTGLTGPLVLRRILSDNIDIAVWVLNAWCSCRRAISSGAAASVAVWMEPQYVPEEKPSRPYAIKNDAGAVLLFV